MASVLRSARRSTAGFFDFIGNTTNTAASLVRTAARSVEMLDAKAELMHDRVLTNCKLQRVNMTSEEILTAADAHADMIEDSHRRNFPNEPFDRTAVFRAAVAKMEAVLAEAQ
ncbi:MAG: hypothetical protein ACT4OK_11125 [Gemmobacter sp.]